ncbi:50S ribosomal protein L3 [Patescibacteria group bacterium]|nr:50S ribosomal protein L3 [Patescibacteria group bacterium]MBU1457375.1 50S ribosomal protein L3 [Patescibacteria group bacterium]
MIKQIYATKLSMSQVFLEGKRIPVTLLKVPTHTVLGQRTQEKNGYISTIVGIGKTKKPANKPLAGLLKKNAIKIAPKFIKEIKADQFDLEKILVPGSTISVTGTSKGKGFTGTIKRWNFAAGPRTHGQSDRRRAPGSIGRGTTPGRVLPGKKMAGRHGGQSINLTNLKIVSFNKESGDLSISGLIPGARNSQVRITITK